MEARSAAPVPAKKDDHKMYVQVKATGDIVEIDLKGDRPEKYGRCLFCNVCAYGT